MDDAPSSDRGSTIVRMKRLGTVVEVADAQRLLGQAEVDDTLSKLAVWRALFAMAAAQGHIEEFLAAASR